MEPLYWNFPEVSLPVTADTKRNDVIELVCIRFVLVDFTMDAKTDALEVVFVVPADSVISGFETTDNGRLRVPARCIDDLSDFLMVRKCKK